MFGIPWNTYNCGIDRRKLMFQSFMGLTVANNLILGC